MDSSRLIASIPTALSCLQSQEKHYCTPYLRTIMRGLRVVRTFLLCSTTLANNAQLRAEDNNVSGAPSLRSLEPLLVKIEDVIRRISGDHKTWTPWDLRKDIRAFEEDIDTWYRGFSDYLQQYPTSFAGNQIKVIVDSVLENLMDHLSFIVGIDQDSEKEVRKIEALEKNFRFAMNFIRFGTLFSDMNQEFRCLQTRIERLVISAAHLVLSIFSNHEEVSSKISVLLLEINHVDNPLMHERYTLALASLKHSQRLCFPTFGLDDDPPMVILEDFVASLISALWEMLQFTTHHLLSLKGIAQELYQGLVLLRTLVKKQQCKFDIAGATICDAGVIIFSLYQKDIEIDRIFRCFQDNIKAIRAVVLGEQVVRTPRCKYSETNVLGFLDFLLEDYLTDVKSSCSSSLVPKIGEHLCFLRLFLGKLVELRNQEESLHQDLWDISVEAAYKIEFLIDQLVLGDTPDSCTVSLQSITEAIMTVEADSLPIMNDERGRDIYEVQQITWPSGDEVPSMSSNKSVVDEVVGFDSEKASIVNRLLRGFKKLQVVAVVGMPGLGKTTLASKVYSTPSISHYFHVKACCSISQVFDRRKVLLELLNQIKSGESNSTMNDHDLSQDLWRSLRRRRYLIFIDDIWDAKAFDLLKESLPDDSNESRILLTSRHGDVVPEAFLDDKPLYLRHLTVDESMELLQRKLFPGQKEWPSELHESGMEIAEYCKGLPLTIVIVAGILKNMEQQAWKDVVKTMRSSIISDVSDLCESTIELSYRHLPDHLKPCFLWFSAFPEDHEYSAKKLIWLWIAEGLVRKSEFRSLEDVAAGYLKNLIGRSLVMNVKERSTGGVKVCRIHDLLHDFCSRKAREDYFLHVMVEGNERQECMFDDESENPNFDEPENPRRLCMYAEPHHLQNYNFFLPHLRSLLFLTPIGEGRYPDLSFIFRIYKLLRVLDVEQVYLKEWPSEVGFLAQLRYLAIQCGGNICSALGNLSNLETLILNELVGLPETFWTLRKLRHLHSKNGAIELPVNDSDSSCNLSELETITTLCAWDCNVLQKQMRKFPNIRRMKFKLFDQKDCKVMDFSFLSRLESLTLSSFRADKKWFEMIFPENLKKLALSGTQIPRHKIASIAKLPNLEVLKLHMLSFLGKRWHVEEGEFSKLKYLKLSLLHLAYWTSASDDLFPNLEKLVLVCCSHLKVIPDCLENAATLKLIEVIDCPDHVASLVKKVEEFQKDMGNSILQVHEIKKYTCSIHDYWYDWNDQMCALAALDLSGSDCDGAFIL